jgi:hypothetical protein
MNASSKLPLKRVQAMNQAPFEVNVSSKYGAPMGRSSDDAEAFVGQTVQLRKVPVVDGDYDPGGAYWGSPTDLYCAWNDELTFYTRASSREAAMAELPGAIFEVPSEIKVEKCPDAFFYAYVECALWSSNDESDDNGGSPIDDNYSSDDLDEDTALEMRKDCDAFYIANATDLYLAGDDQSGHDFWLDRNHHGCGFTDREELYGEKQAERLMRAAQAFGECHLYVENGKVYCE